MILRETSDLSSHQTRHLEHDLKNVEPIRGEIAIPETLIRLLFIELRHYGIRERNQLQRIGGAVQESWTYLVWQIAATNVKMVQLRQLEASKEITHPSLVQQRE
jgi:hypothetical protein